MNVLILFTCLLYVYRFVSREINPALGFEKDAVHRCSCKEQLINANHPTQQKVPQGQKATKSDVSFEPLINLRFTYYLHQTIPALFLMAW